MANRLNLHIDETGNQDLSEGLYLVAVVLHKHDVNIDEPIVAYERRLSIAGIKDVPFHGKDLLHGNENYRLIQPGDRKRALTQFARLVRELPFTYFCLHYDSADTRSRAELESRIRHDLASLIYEHLAFFQAFDTISVYYDNGQGAVSLALHDALDFVLAKNVADYRDADHNTRKLLQVADYICTIERAAIFYDTDRQSKTYERFFGSRRQFMQSFMKQLARKRFCTKSAHL